MMTAQDMRDKLGEGCSFLDGKASCVSWKDSRLTLNLPLSQWTGEAVLIPRATPAQLELFLLRREAGLLPALIAPFLSAQALQRLDEAAEMVIALDLSGNGLVKTSDCYLFKTGLPNQFPETGRTRRSYAGASAQVAMTLLEQQEWTSQTEVLKRLTSRGGSLTRGQLSKLIAIYREDDALRRLGRKELVVHRPSVLLEKLSQEWSLPIQEKAFFSFSPDEDWASFARKAGERQLTWCLSPSSSLSRYAPLGEGGARCVWTTDLDAMIDACKLLPASAPAFADIELVKQRSALGYFQTFADRTGLVWSGPVTTWLAAAHGDARQQETAQILYRGLIRFQFGQYIRR